MSNIDQEDLMDIVEALRKEEIKLQRQLAGIQGAITALNGIGSTGAISPMGTNGVKTVRIKRTMSAALRARLSQKAKERWAKYRAAQGKGKKAK
jgi:hypothetical protein